MLKITNTVITKDGQAVVGDVTYAVNYSISNNEITAIQCAISSMKDDRFEQIGYIRKENGRLNTDFLDNGNPIEHLTIFDGILKEIEADAFPVPKKMKSE